ncbi:hypothetical protein [Streptomyces sp. NRRL S-118]|uniref:hypothetical protein n=1 Tax=Streptomyces sp. NRRL S-118 TaxID=1463881 RepID=UPI00131C78F8|nr:hypothetical protein [Streptomyces sp. NRRL S-118]
MGEAHGWGSPYAGARTSTSRTRYEGARMLMRERAGKAAWGLVAGSASTWGAAQVTRGVELDGPAARQAAVVLIVLALARLAHLPVLALKHGLPRLGRVGAVRRHEAAVGCTVTAAMVGGVLVAAPLLWWLAEAVCGLLDLPLHISGARPLVVVALADLLLGMALTALRGPLTAEGRAQGAAGRLGRLAVSFGVLWLLTVALDGIRPDTDAWWRTLLAMAALAVLFSLLGTGFTVSHDLGWPALRQIVLRVLPFLAVGSVAGSALMLWLVSWFSTALRPTLHVSGFGTFLLGGLVTAALMWAAGLPFFLRGLRRRGLSLRAVPPRGGAYGPDAPCGAVRRLSVRGTGFGFLWPQPRPAAAPAPDQARGRSRDPGPGPGPRP